MKCRRYTPNLDRKLEAALNPCECGGYFRADAPYRCPVCNAPFDREEVIGNIDAKVGLLVMSKAVDAAEYWKEPKNLPPL